MKRSETYALIKKRNGWFITWRIPAILKDHPFFKDIPGNHYCKTLMTGDLKEAQRKRDLILSNFEQLKAQALEAPKRHKFNTLLAEIQQAVREAEGKYDTTTLPDGSEVSYPTEAVHLAFDLETAVEKGDEVRADAIRAGLHGNTYVHSKYAITLKEAAAAFIKEKQQPTKGKPVAAATLSKAKTGAESLSLFLGKPNALLQDIDRRQVTRWLDYLMDSLSDSTRAGYLTALVAVWEWCYVRGDVDGVNPFKGAKVTSAGDKQSYTPFTVEELALVLPHCTDKVRTLVKFGLLTACRISELTVLRAENFEVHGNVHVVCIREGKTAAAARVIPLPVTYWEELKLCATNEMWVGARGSTDSNVWSMKFGKAKRNVLGNEGKKSFHSLRGMTLTAYQRAGVPEVIAASLAGHATKGLTMSYGLYSSGYDYAQLLQAVETMLASPYMSEFLKLFNK